MRLLHVIHTLNPLSGGPASAVRNFAAHPFDSIHSVLSMDQRSDSWAASYPVPVFCAGPGRGNYGFTRNLDAWFKSHVAGYDALILHGCWQYHTLAASKAARAANVPYFLFPHGMLDPYFNRSNRLKHLKKLLYWSFERSIIEGARAVLFTCEEERKRAKEAFRFECTSEIVSLGVEPSANDPKSSRDEFLARFPGCRAKRCILFLSRLHPKKGIDLLIRAFSELGRPDFHLILAGPPASASYRTELENLVSSLCPPDSLTFTGMLSGSLKSGAFAAANVFVLPSHQENFGLAVVEALAESLPVLISDQVNLWREIQQDGAGFVAPDTLPGCAGLLRRWLALDSNSIEAMRRAAFNCFHSRFRAEAAAQKLLVTLRQAGIGSHESTRIQLHTVAA